MAAKAAPDSTKDYTHFELSLFLVCIHIIIIIPLLFLIMHTKI